MTKTLTLFLLLGVSLVTTAQENIGIIGSNQQFQNPFDYDLFYMPRAKVLEFMNLSTKAEFDSLRIVKYKELVQSYEERIFLSDSATRLRKLEADFWNQQLIANDLKLEEERKENIQLRADLQSAKRSRIYYFVAGIVSTAIVIGVTN